MEDIDDFSVTVGKDEVHFRIMRLENGLTIFISSAPNFKIGPIAVAVPPSLGRTEPSSSSPFGANDATTFVRIIAERVAVWTNQSCLAVVSLKGLNRLLVMDLLKALKPHLLS